MTTPSMRVLFRAAAGPRLGFGHLIRCRSLARALGVPAVVSLRGTGPTRAAARRLGFQVADGDLRAWRAATTPCLLVVDDPSAEHADVWVARAQRLGVPVATVHDLGLGYVPSDLGIDGSVRPHRAMRGRCGDLKGPAYAMLDPQVVRWRDRRSAIADPLQILIALGGGAHVVTLAARLSRVITAACPRARIAVAAGFSAGRRLPTLTHAEWVVAPDGLGEQLARAAVAVLAGGVTLYEACAVGTPSVAVALTPAQALTVRAMADADAAIDGGRLASGSHVDAIAAHVAHLIGDARTQRRLSAAGRALVDGRGIFRVADRVRELADLGREAHRAA